MRADPRKKPRRKWPGTTPRAKPRCEAGAGFKAQEIGRRQEGRTAQAGKNPPLPAGFAQAGGSGRGNGRRDRVVAQGHEAEKRSGGDPDPVLQGKIGERFHQERIGQESSQRARVGPGVNGEVAAIGLLLMEQRGCAKKAEGQSGKWQERGQRLQFRRKPCRHGQRRRQGEETAQAQRGQDSISGFAVRLPQPPASKVSAQDGQLKKEDRAAPDRGRPAELRQEPFAGHEFALKGQSGGGGRDEILIFQLQGRIGFSSPPCRAGQGPATEPAALMLNPWPSNSRPCLLLSRWLAGLNCLRAGPIAQMDRARVS